MVRPLVSASSPADALIRRHYKAWDGGAGCTGPGGALPEGEREAHHPLRPDAVPPLDAIKPGHHRRSRQDTSAPGGSQERATQCGASLSTPPSQKSRPKRRVAQPPRLTRAAGGSTSRTPSSRGLGSARSKASVKRVGEGDRGMGGTKG